MLKGFWPECSTKRTQSRTVEQAQFGPGSRVVTEYYDAAGLTDISINWVSQRRLWVHDLYRKFGAA